MSDNEQPGTETAVKLRTNDWYGRPLAGFGHRSWMKRGLPDDAFTGKPQIGIASSWSELTPCNSHLDEVAEHVKRGVWEAGGVPHVFPTTSLRLRLPRRIERPCRDPGQPLMPQGRDHHHSVDNTLLCDPESAKGAVR